ncbi:MAG: hypothetical protein ACRDHZ_03830 [Ktedonobacteraceae bacterium]
MFSSPYPRPKKLSDPYSDWLPDKLELLEQIIRMTPEELKKRDYDTIFQSVMPAASYEEGVWYLDYCFKWMQSLSDVATSSIIIGVFDFIKDHHEALSKDNLLSDCIYATKKIFSSIDTTWSEELFSTRVGKEGSFPPYCESIYDLVYCCIKYDPLFPCIQSLVIEWAARDDWKAAIWWMEMFENCKSWVGGISNSLLGNDKDAKVMSRMQTFINNIVRLEIIQPKYALARRFARKNNLLGYAKRISPLSR